MRIAARSPSSRSGFTLVEIMGAAALLGVVLTLAMTSFFHVTRSDVEGSAQADLDMDARRLMERLRRDLWRTSRDEVILYPPGDGPYSAISFPVLFAQSETNPVPRNADGSIRWEATVIYHLWSGTPPEVRRTVFSPRVTLDAAGRLAQLAQTVLDGNGRQTHNGNNATTRRMIANLVDWRLNVSGPSFDGYAESPGRRQANLGSAVLSDGMHDFTFRIKGKNSRSSGHRVGVDWVTASPSGSAREGEWQTVSAASGGTPTLDLIQDGTWSGNYRLGFSGAPGASFTLRMENDRWEERNFFHTSALMDDSLAIGFDTRVTPNSYALQLTGNDITWRAQEQTAHAGSELDDNSLDNTAVRVLLRGDDLLDDSGFVNLNGTNVWVRFRSGALLRNLRIAAAFIAESDPTAPMNYRAGTRRQILFSDNAAVVVAPQSAIESDPVPYVIRKTNSYLVGFYVAHPGWSAPVRWQAWTAASGSPQSYVIRNATQAHHDAASWSGVPATNRIFAVESVRVGFAPEGRYQSRIIDTRQDAPEYRTFEWSASAPDGAAVELRVRSGSQPDLSDAPAWDQVGAAINGAQLFLNGRYVQIQARLRPGGTTAQTTPQLRAFTLRWKADTRSVDLGGIFSTGPDHGIVELLVDGQPLVQAMTVDLTVYKEVAMGGGRKRRFTASAFAEIVPRNTKGLLETE